MCAKIAMHWIALEIHAVLNTFVAVSMVLEPVPFAMMARDFAPMMKSFMVGNALKVVMKKHAVIPLHPKNKNKIVDVTLVLELMAFAMRARDFATKKGDAVKVVAMLKYVVMASPHLQINHIGSNPYMVFQISYGS